MLCNECCPTSERGVPRVATCSPRRARIAESHRRARLAKRTRSHSDSGSTEKSSARTIATVDISAARPAIDTARTIAAYSRCWVVGWPKPREKHQVDVVAINYGLISPNLDLGDTKLGVLFRLGRPLPPGRHRASCLWRTHRLRASKTRNRCYRNQLWLDLSEYGSREHLTEGARSIEISIFSRRHDSHHCYKIAQKHGFGAAAAI